MIATLFIGAAAAMQSPQALRMQDWWGADEYPLEALRRQVSGWVDFALTISPEGKVIDCAVELSSGSQYLDAPTCDLAKRRARLRAATDAQGKPVLGVFRGRTTWNLPSAAMPRKPLYNQLVLNLQALPQGVVNPSYVGLDLVVDADGKIAGCNATPVDADVIAGKKADFEKSASVLGEAACNFAPPRLKVSAAKDASGGAQPSVQRVTVIFTAQP